LLQGSSSTLTPSHLTPPMASAPGTGRVFRSRQYWHVAEGWWEGGDIAFRGSSGHNLGDSGGWSQGFVFGDGG
jgi:hypothetical protein